MNDEELPSESDFDFEFKFEHDGPSEDEAIAAAQEAQKAYRDERDKAISDDEFEHRKFVKEHGFSLAWWRDESLAEGWHALYDVVNNVFDKTAYGNALYSHGLDRSVLTSSLSLDAVSGPLVMAALQMLGIWVPSLRPDIEAVLISIPKPDPTEDEKGQVAEAQQRILGEQTELLASELAKLQEDNGDAGISLS